jgi:CHAT domain-containing protein
VGKPKLADVQREVEQIRDGLKDIWKDQVEINLLITDTDTAPSGSEFRRILLSGSYDIVHYAGHAAFDAGRPDQSGLLLDGDEVCFAQKIQRLLQGHPLVFLNACETARLTESDERPPPEGTYESDPRDGLASAFVYGGALACIGAMWPVSDDVAADFAVAFYGQVLEGQPLGQAMLKARQHTADAYKDDPSWAAFVLYGDPSFQLAPLVHPPA